MSTLRYWTRPVHLRYEAGKRAERALMALVWRLPRRLVFWCAVRVGAHATTGAYSNQVVPELRFTDALQRWETR